MGVRYFTYTKEPAYYLLYFPSDMGDPLLQFKDENGTVHSEYIPTELTLIGLWYERCRKYLAVLFGWDCYWWHFDHLYPPHVRKQYDMHFIQHVDEAHDGQPEDRKERRHYNSLLFDYRHEYEWMKAELVKQDAFDKDDTISGAHPHHYSYAYRWRWLETELEPEWNVLYHGAPFAECLDLVDRDFEKRGWNKELEELFAAE